MENVIDTAVGLRLLKNNSLFWSMLGWPYDPPRLNAEGKPILFLRNSERVQGYHRNFYRAGIRIHTSLLFSGWLDADRFDYTETDRTLEELFACGDDILYLPRIKLNVPMNWGKSYPEEMCVYYPGTLSVEKIRSIVNTPRHDIAGADLQTGYHSWFKEWPDQWTDDRPNVGGLIGNQSFASAQWLKDAGEALSRLVRHIEDGPYGGRIVGYHIAYGMCGETTLWRSWDKDDCRFADYGFCCRCAFYDWGVARYGSREALAKAWNQPDIDRESVRLPSPFERELEWKTHAEFFRAGPENVVCSDYERFMSDRNLDALEHFGRIVKRESRKAVGAFYGYYLNVPRVGHAGHLAFERLLNSPYLDFVASPKAYQRVVPGEPGGEQVPAMSINRRKFFVDELDNRTHLTGMEAGNMFETRTVLWREFAKNIAAGSGFWWMDLGGGWFDSPEILREIAKIEACAARLRARPVAPVAEVLMVSDENGFLASKPNRELHTDLLVDTPAEIQLAGAPVDHYRYADLATLDLSRYKAVCLLNCFEIDRAEWARISARLRPDAVIVWHYASGIRNETGYDPESVAGLCGMRLQSRDYDPRRGVELCLPEGICFHREFEEREYPLFELFGLEPGEILGRYADGGVAFGRRRQQGRLHYFCCLPLLRGWEYRAIFDAVGVRSYAPAGNTVYADSRFAGIFSRAAAAFPLNLPGKVAEECLTGNVEPNVQMRAKDARLYLYE